MSRGDEVREVSPGPLAVGRDGGAEKEMDGDGREDEEANVRGGVGEVEEGLDEGRDRPTTPRAPEMEPAGVSRGGEEDAVSVSAGAEAEAGETARAKGGGFAGTRRGGEGEDEAPGGGGRGEGGDARVIWRMTRVPAPSRSRRSARTSTLGTPPRSARSSARPPSAADRETRRRASVISPRAGPCDEGTRRQAVIPASAESFGRRHRAFHVQRYPLRCARRARAIRPGGGAAPSPRRSSRASRRGSTRVPRATSSPPTDDAADKRRARRFMTVRSTPPPPTTISRRPRVSRARGGAQP